jgi:TldD protein
MVEAKRSAAALDAMARELKRTMRLAHLPGHKKPFFVSYLAQHSDAVDTWGRYGAIFHSSAHRDTTLHVDVRVGSYATDQLTDGGLRSRPPEDRESFQWIAGPRDLDDEALRYAFWRLTQLRYAEALQDYYDKQKVLVDHSLVKRHASFSKEEPIVHLERPRRSALRRDDLEDFVRSASRRFRGHRDLEDPYVQVRRVHETRLFVNSEGTRFVTEDYYDEVMIAASRLTRDGSRMNANRAFHARKPGRLPDAAAIQAAVDEVASDLASQAKAEPAEPYAGPALLSGIATGLVFHEAIGHRLEGERLLSRAEGHTFAGKIGQRLLPPGVDLVDDPTVRRHGGKDLLGHYRIDDEGVPAQRVELIRDGVLRSFLGSRNCIPGSSRSNGHGRLERFQGAMARMGNLFVVARDKRPLAELKLMLRAEAKRRELPYGIYVKHAVSGETITASDQYDFQGFKGNPTEVYTIDAKTGRERRVRDVSFIGTPLAVLQSILAFGGDDEVDNSYCGAESGILPVGTIAPSMLVAELELQRSNRTGIRGPVLPLPPMES